MEKVTQLIEVALSQVGVEEIPRGSNRGEKVEEYMKATGTIPPAAWCGCFAAWCFKEAGYKLDKPWLLAAARNWFKDSTKLIKDKKDIQPGDVFGIHNAKLGRIAHVGIIEKVENGMLYTIEGNTNDEGSREGYEVAKRKRSISKVAAIARWT